MLLTAFLLFVISDTGMPTMTALAGYETQAECESAAQAINNALASGSEAQHVSCISVESLHAFAETNKLGEN
ncbi:MAG: hypothetical protein ABL866_01140 [Devosia sp.]